MDADWEMLRRAMVESQLRARGIRDQRVLRALETVPRHEFVPPQEQLRAYDDGPLAIGFGQTISQPYIVGFMTELLEVELSHKVLEVGTGSGYQTAILALLAREVFTMDLHPALVDAARVRLTRLGFSNIHFAVRDGHSGWREEGRFDRIIVTAGGTFIPEPLIDDLAEGGRMVMPAGPSGSDQILKLVLKRGPSDLEIRDTIPVRFVPLVHQKPQE